MGLEAALEFGAVGALHDEDQVGLVEVVGRDRLLRIGRQAGGGGLDAGARGEDALGRGGAEAVAGAEEQEGGQIQSLKMCSRSTSILDRTCCARIL